MRASRQSTYLFERVGTLRAGMARGRVAQGVGPAANRLDTAEVDRLLRMVQTTVRRGILEVGYRTGRERLTTTGGVADGCPICKG